jgi:Ran GTPase-activating protein (RanGAP) involved in mRNA processing and transport
MKEHEEVIICQLSIDTIKNIAKYEWENLLHHKNFSKCWIYVPPMNTYFINIDNDPLSLYGFLANSNEMFFKTNKVLCFETLNPFMVGELGSVKLFSLNNPFDIAEALLPLNILDHLQLPSLNNQNILISDQASKIIELIGMNINLRSLTLKNKDPDYIAAIDEFKSIGLIDNSHFFTQTSYAYNQNNGLINLIKALENQSTINTLRLAYNEINDSGASAISKLLRVNINIKLLNLTGNYITEKGAQGLAEAITLNTEIEELYLGDNQLGDIGASYIAKALPFCKKLRALDLGLNGIKLHGASVLAQTIPLNKSLQILNLGDNDMGHEAASKIFHAVNKAPNILELDLKRNEIGEIGASFAAEFIKNNNSLVKLNLKNNMFIEKDNLAVMNSLKDNYSLTSIDINDIFPRSQDYKLLVEKSLENNYYIYNFYTNSVSHNNFDTDDSDYLYRNKLHVKLVQLILKKAVNFYYTEKNPLNAKELKFILDENYKFAKSQLNAHKEWIQSFIKHPESVRSSAHTAQDILKELENYKTKYFLELANIIKKDLLMDQKYTLQEVKDIEEHNKNQNSERIEIPEFALFAALPENIQAEIFKYIPLSGFVTDSEFNATVESHEIIGESSASWLNLSSWSCTIV